jgi:hypothetical protein
MSGDIFYPPGSGVAIADGHPVPVGKNQVTAGEVMAELKSVINLPYTGTDPDKRGLTLLEAAARSLAVKAADGDIDAFSKWMDRVLGKPIQQVLSASGSLKDFLNRVAESSQVVETSGTSDEVDPFGD